MKPQHCSYIEFLGRVRKMTNSYFRMENNSLYVYCLLVWLLVEAWYLLCWCVDLTSFLADWSMFSRMSYVLMVSTYFVACGSSWSMSSTVFKKKIFSFFSRICFPFVSLRVSFNYLFSIFFLPGFLIRSIFCVWF